MKKIWKENENGTTTGRDKKEWQINSFLLRGNKFVEYACFQSGAYNAAISGEPDAHYISERMDGKNIYEICDYNVPYEISLKEAINKGALVPFHYYGIYDETDYSSLHIVKGHYDEKELNETYY